MKRSLEIKAELEALETSVAAILAQAEEEDRELTAEEDEEVKEALGDEEEGGKTEGKIKTLKAQLATAQKREAFASRFSQERINALASNNPHTSFQAPGASFTIPAKARATGKLQHFKTEADAYASGQFILGHIFGNEKSKAWCNEHGVKAAMSTGDNSKGGYLVPEPLENTIIELRESFGVFRQHAAPWTMTDGSVSIPKLTGDVATYFVGEGDTISESDPEIGLVKLQARKLATIVPFTSEFNEDSVISAAELITRSIAHSLAVREDQCGFNGDGSVEYGNIIGLAGALQAGSKVTANSQSTFGALTLGTFEAAMGKLKWYDGIQPCWFMSRAGYYASVERLLNAAGGNNNMDLANGATPRFGGYPVIFSESMEKALTGTTGKIAAYFGDLRMSAYFGTRRGVSIKADESIYFKQEMIAIRATERFDIQVHETGSSDESGSIVAVVFG